MSEWKKVKLGDILEIKHGFAFSGEHIIEDDNNIVLVTPGNFRIGGGFQEKKCKFFDGEIPQDYILKEGDFIVTMTDLSKTIDTLGFSAYIPKSDKRIYLHNQRIGLVSFKNDECDRGYIYWLMRTRAYQRTIANTSTGSTVHHTSPTKICDYECFVPKKSTQHRIATILSRYDSLIENYQKQIKLLEEAAQRLYKEWFVDLRFPGHENTKIVDGVPEGWEKKNVNNILTFHRGYDLTHKEFVDGPYPVVGSTSIIGNHNKYKIEGPGIVTGRSGSLGVYQLIWDNYWPHNTSLYISDFKGHIYCLLKTVDFTTLNSGGAIPSLNRNTLSNISVMEPPMNLQAKFSKIVMPMFKRLRHLQSQIRLLAEARDRLLPKLMSGEILV